jgi:hypothetical protein
VALAVAACQPLPRPFLPADKASRDTTRLPFDDKLGLFVAGIDDVPAALSEAVASRLADRLLDLGIPASPASANRGSYLLQCVADFDGRDRLSLRWQLIDSDGEIVGLFEQVARFPAAEVQDRLAALSEEIAEQAAPRIAGLLDRAAAPAAAPALPDVVLRPVDGAPGDGRQALRRAMGTALARHDIRVVPELAEGTLVVLGSVRTQARGGTELVEVRWAVRAVDGAELGAISQSNTVPAGLLDGAWGPIADAVADGAAAGLLALLQAAGRP